MALYLDSADLATWNYAIVTSGLDYYDTLYIGILSNSTWEYQLLQNTTDHLLSGTRQYTYIIPILQSFP